MLDIQHCLYNWLTHALYVVEHHLPLYACIMLLEKVMAGPKWQTTGQNSDNPN